MTSIYIICEQWMDYLMTNITSPKMYSNLNEKSLWLPVKKHTIPGYCKLSKISYTCTYVHFFPEFIGFTNKVCIWTESADKAGLAAVEDRWPWSGEQRTKRPSVRDRGGKGQDRGNSGESAEKCQAVQAKTEGQPGTNL